MSVLIYIESSDHKLKKSAYEIASYAKAIAEKLNTLVSAVAIGDIARNELESLGKYGVSKVVHVSGEKLKNFVNQAYASVIADVSEKEQANVVVLSNSLSGKGLAPRVAIKLNAGIADGAVDLPDINGGKFVVKKTAFSNKAFAFVELESGKKVISLNPNSYQVIEKPENLTIEEYLPEIKDTDLKTVVKEIAQASNKVSLADADIVVSAGRGLKGPENWAMVEELANLLGAATACSKPVSDAGWRPHSEHVGQTGLAISPNLYIAIGISGAIQHLAGVSSSKTIVVINKDPEAPFFKVADYGIVGDAFEIVPKIIEEVKSLKANS